MTSDPIRTPEGRKRLQEALSRTCAAASMCTDGAMHANANALNDLLTNSLEFGFLNSLDAAVSFGASNPA